jgi:uncharacterized repeat protein (TIGR03803 family)
LYSFNGLDGRTPRTGLTKASDNNYYGTTAYGGTNNVGTIFRLAFNSVPQPIILYIEQSGNSVTFGWSAIVGQIYRTQFKSALSDTNWADLGPSVIATNATMTTTDSLSGSNRFYQIALLP